LSRGVRCRTKNLVVMHVTRQSASLVGIVPDEDYPPISKFTESLPNSISATSIGERVSMSQSCKRCFVALLAGVVSIGLGYAQTDTGSISGYIKDPSGAVVPKAAIDLKNEGTSEVHKQVTNDAGYYAVPNLPPGLYTMTVEASGFRRFESSHNRLDSNTALSLNADCKSAPARRRFRSARRLRYCKPSPPRCRAKSAETRSTCRS